MSFDTLSRDPRYRERKGRFTQLVANLSVADPALADGRVAARGQRIIDDMAALAVEHGWDPARQAWAT